MDHPTSRSVARRTIADRALVLVCALLGSTHLAQAQQYTLTPVGNLGGTYGGVTSHAFGINKAGAVVGFGFDASLNQQAFFYSSGTGTQLLPPQTTIFSPRVSIATAINQQGVAVGDATGDNGDAVMWATSPITTPAALGSVCTIFPESSANAVNSSGDAVGLTRDATCGSPTTDDHAALFSNGAVIDLGTLGTLGVDTSEAFGINDSGVVVGDSYIGQGIQHAFYWDGSMHDLGTFPGGLWSHAYAINASGVIVGYSDLPGVANGHAFIIPPGGVMQDLTPGSALESHASAINASGQIVGFMASVAGEVPFLYSNGTVTDLNTLIDPADPLAPYVTLTDSFAYGVLIPVSINDNGWIVADGTDSRTGAQQAYLLTPNSAFGVTLSPTRLSFAGQPRTTTGAAQTITLTSSGTAGLTISSITASAGFTLTTNCPIKPATLGPGTPCAINVASSPTTAGPYTGSVTIVDNASGSSQTVALSGTGTDFSLSLAPVLQTVKPGKTAVYTLTATPLFGFTGNVFFTCTGYPVPGGCSGFGAVFLNGTNVASGAVGVDAAKKAPKGTYTIRLTGTSGTLQETTTSTLTVR